jgi:hypothetical protein
MHWKTDFKIETGQSFLATLAAIAGSPQEDTGEARNRAGEPVKPAPTRAAAPERATAEIAGTAIARLSLWPPQISLPGEDARPKVGIGAHRPPGAQGRPAGSFRFGRSLGGHP